MPQIAGAPEEVRPDFRLHQHDGLGADGGQRAGDIAAAVDRIVDLADVVGQLPPQFAHAGRGGGGDDDLEVGQARFQRADELGAEVDLADADGVHPERVAVGDGLLEFGVVFAEPLGEARLPIAAPPHSQEVVRRRQRKTKP